MKKDTDLRHAQLWGANLKNAKLQEAQLQGAVLRWAQLQGAVLIQAQLQGAGLRGAAVYGTRFQDAELSLADLRGLSLPRDEWEGLSSVFLEVEELEARLEQEGKHWSEEGRERVEWAIEHFWSIAFELPSEPTAISPLQGFEVMHDWQGLFATWPAPPDEAAFEQERADYRAGLACDNQYIAERMWKGAKKTDWNEGDPVLEQALRAKAEDCSVLAEVLEKN